MIRRARSGLKDPNRPNWFIHVPRSYGCRKTELAKAWQKQCLAVRIHSFVWICLSLWRNTVQVVLIGSPPGYVGYDEGGQLTEKIRSKPYSVILLDEVEKAHPDVFNILLQVLDDGHLTDAKGRKVDFRNTILIMTSNIGAQQIREERM